MSSWSSSTEEEEDRDRHSGVAACVGGSSGKGTFKPIAKRRSVGLSGTMADTDVGHAVVLPVWMPLYQQQGGFLECGKVKIVWEFPWQPECNQPF